MQVYYIMVSMAIDTMLGGVSIYSQMEIGWSERRM